MPRFCLVLLFFYFLKKRAGVRFIKSLAPSDSPERQTIYLVYLVIWEILWGISIQPCFLTCLSTWYHDQRIHRRKFQHKQSNHLCPQCHWAAPVLWLTHLELQLKTLLNIKHWIDQSLTWWKGNLWLPFSYWADQLCSYCVHSAHMY